MANYEFIGGDAVDHFHAGRVAPGDVVAFDEDPGAGWKVTKRRPTRASAADLPEATTEHGSAVPDAPEEV